MFSVGVVEGSRALPRKCPEAISLFLRSLTQTCECAAGTSLVVQWLRIHLFSWENLAVSILLLLISHFSRVRLCATPWTAAHQVPPPLGFSSQEYWSGLPFPSPIVNN